MLYDVLMKAASEGISIDAACRDLDETVGANTICELLNAQLNTEELEKLEREMNAALSAQLPTQVQMSGVDAAIDEHDEPCYAKRPELRAYTVSNRAKAGTTRFFRIISLYVIYRQMRLTVAVVFVITDLHFRQAGFRALLRE